MLNFVVNFRFVALCYSWFFPLGYVIYAMLSDINLSVIFYCIWISSICFRIICVEEILTTDSHEISTPNVVEVSANVFAL
jgi:hypothetical protein